ncbi:MAG: nitroreductase family protein [Bacillota bacterium]|nr:nitroreductase family protein [Bacillota bacterium]
MDAIEAMKSRASVRKYDPRSIPKEIVEDIVDCGRLAPTGANAQGWVFVVVTAQEVRGQIADLCRYGKFIRDAGACVCVFCRKDTLCEVEDACAATENMMIAAVAHGLGTCWVNSHRKVHSTDIERLLGCPEGYELVTMFSLGYPAEITRKSKKTLEEVLRWERF